MDQKSSEVFSKALSPVLLSSLVWHWKSFGSDNPTLSARVFGIQETIPVS